MMKPEKEIEIIKYCIDNEWKNNHVTVPAPMRSKRWSLHWSIFSLIMVLFGYIHYYVVFCLCHIFQIRKQQLLLCIVINEFPSFFWWSGCALLGWARLLPLFSPFQFCCRRTVHIHKSHSEINTAILPFAYATANAFLHKSG